MELKYKLTDETIVHEGHVLHRIQALKDIKEIDVCAGDFGGYVESERNLSQRGNCWIFNNAKVYDRATVLKNAQVRYEAKVYDYAIVDNQAVIDDFAKVHGGCCISQYAAIYSHAEIKGNVSIYGCCNIEGNAVIDSDKDYIVFKNWWSSGRTFVWTRSNNKWSVGCFYGTGEELIAKAYKDSPISGREYERIVKYVEDILKQ